MTPELWERLSPLFNHAVERPSAERGDFVAAACGDDSELRRELLALVEAHERQESASEEISVKIRNSVTAAGTPSPGDLILNRFEVIRHIGAGGMGDVYEAFDRELAQTIALKMIRRDIAGDEGILIRFKKEVQLARRLTGPNICRTHELFVIKADGGLTGQAFFTMEFLQGVTLAERLANGALPWREAGPIAQDICAGLGMIHRAGIIHRDLKSRNIMLADRDGSIRAVLMDFGLARELPVPGLAGETGLTMPGLVLGTPEYMAPEQFEGKAPTPATDIFAIGIILYELLTGRHPFASSNPLGAAVLRGRRPVPASGVNHTVPHQWDVVIGKCLEYDPSRRYQSAEELARALRLTGREYLRFHGHKSRVIAAGVGLTAILASALYVPALRERLEGIVLANHEKHIAVLPFDVEGNSKDTALLADGLMDSLTGKLTNLDPQNQTLWVIPASEVRRRKVSDPSSALRQFGATMVVKGHFHRDNKTVRLNLELIDARNMREIGYADVENEEEDLSALQDDAVTRLGRLMNIAIRDEDARGPEGVSASAYEDYITALGYLLRYDKPDNLDGAIRLLTRATRVSPDFALALGKLGEAYTLKYEVDANPDSLKLARTLCTRAIALDNRITAPYAALAALDGIAGQNELAAQEYQHVLDLDPKNVEALTGIALLYKREGQIDKAEQAYLRAAALRPDDWMGYNYLGNFYDDVGRHREAIIQLQHAMTLAPDNAYVYCNLGAAYLNSGDPALFVDTEKAFKKSISLNPTYQAYAGLGNLYGIQQRFKESAEVTEKAVQLDDQDFEIWNNLSQAYDGIGDEQNASRSRKQGITLAERAIVLNARNADAHATLAALLARTGIRDEAMRHILTALSLAPKEQDVLSEVAEAYESLGDRKQAIKYLELALANGFPPMQLNGDIVLKRIATDRRFSRK